MVAVYKMEKCLIRSPRRAEPIHLAITNELGNGPKFRGSAPNQEYRER